MNNNSNYRLKSDLITPRHKLPPPPPQGRNGFRRVSLLILLLIYRGDNFTKQYLVDQSVKPDLLLLGKIVRCNGSVGPRAKGVNFNATYRRAEAIRKSKVVHHSQTVTTTYLAMMKWGIAEIGHWWKSWAMKDASKKSVGKDSSSYSAGKWSKPSL